MATFSTMNMMELRRRLSEYLSAVSGASAEAEDLRQLVGGTSRETWLIIARVDGAQEKFVLRRDLPASAADCALDRRGEFKLLEAALAAGVRVPRPRWFCIEPLILDGEFLIVDYAAGVSSGRKITGAPELAAARAALPEQLAKQLAHIHEIDPGAAGLNFLPRPAEGLSPAQEAITAARALLDKLQITEPALELGLRWVEERAPEPGRVCLVHGDFRLGNFLVVEDGLNAIIGWEYSHIGDPLEDLAWACVRDWRFGAGQLQLGGIADREPFLAAYERFSGRSVDRRAVDFWEILGNLRRAVTALSQARRRAAGHDPGVESAGLGHRAAEMQYEMLRLIQAWETS